MRHPLYVISKGRPDKCLTARFLQKDRVPFHLVVEPQEAKAYAEAHGRKCLLVTPFSNLGLGSIPARNFVWEHALKSGSERHWILDDNINGLKRFLRGKRIRCASDLALTVVEDFTERYQNIAIAGMNYEKFVVPGGVRPPYVANCHVYSCLLILNSLPYRWRGRYNEDTDLCLQVLSGGWCTVLTNAFMCEKVATMTMKGGNTDSLYRGDGRLLMARSLERMWPGVVTVVRRFHRAQHFVDWKRFTTPLSLRADVQPAEPGRYAMKLKEVKPVQSQTLREWMATA